MCRCLIPASFIRSRGVFAATTPHRGSQSPDSANAAHASNRGHETHAICASTCRFSSNHLSGSFRQGTLTLITSVSVYCPVSDRPPNPFSQSPLPGTSRHLLSTAQFFNRVRPRPHDSHTLTTGHAIPSTFPASASLPSSRSIYQRAFKRSVSTGAPSLKPARATYLTALPRLKDKCSVISITSTGNRR